MAKAEYKIGYAPSGGLYMGENIQTDFHKHHAVIILLTLDQPFLITGKNGEPHTHSAAVIQKDVYHKFSGSGLQVFIYLDPYSENARKLIRNQAVIQGLNVELLREVVEAFRYWFSSADTSEETTQYLLSKTASAAAQPGEESPLLDERISKSITLLQQQEFGQLSLPQVAAAVHLSPSRFTHLFKQQTGSAFRRFMLHIKLINALKALHAGSSLTEAAYAGGFSDQSHFTRTFINAFGTKPSWAVK